MTIKTIFEILLNHFGKQHWWPSQSIDETIIGAILTQNTSWNNVEKSIKILKEKNLLSLKKIKNCKNLREYIKPSGFFNQKERYLKEAAEKIDIKEITKLPPADARKKLLSIKGIGKETADSILLYAFGKPIFVVDAYTKRIFSRLGLISENSTYDETQNFFMDKLQNDTYLFNEYHALIVKLGKEFCTKRNPKCNQCPLKEFCHYHKDTKTILK